MTDDREERIRRRAHEIWEMEGRPEGRQDEHWHRAMEEIDRELAGGTKRGRGASRKATSGGEGADAPAKTRAGRKSAAAGTEAGVAADAPKRGRRKAPADMASEGTSSEGASAPASSRRRKANASGGDAAGGTADTAPKTRRSRKTTSEGTKEDGAPPS